MRDGVHESSNEPESGKVSGSRKDSAERILLAASITIPLMAAEVGYWLAAAIALVLGAFVVIEARSFRVRWLPICVAVNWVTLGLIAYVSFSLESPDIAPLVMVCAMLALLVSILNRNLFVARRAS